MTMLNKHISSPIDSTPVCFLPPWQIMIMMFTRWLFHALCNFNFSTASEAVTKKKQLENLKNERRKLC